VAAKYVLAIDQGTTSSRAIVFTKKGKIKSIGQLEHQQIYPAPGWVEHDPSEIWAAVREVVGLALTRADTSYSQIAAVGITNQRETTVVWNRHSGEPVYNAIVWQDTRTQDICDELTAASPLGRDRYRAITGLPLATYFSGPKIKWILDNVVGARAAAEAGDLLFGTTDSFIVWHMTGGPEGGVHVTDVTNASRTLLMDLGTCQWRDDICADLGIPMSMLPAIRSSSEIYGHARGNGLLPGIPIAGILGDQQAASVGEVCFSVGDVKNTYGTGCFLLMNTGARAVQSSTLLTTVLYQFGTGDPVYALEGSIANSGSVIKWLRDNLMFFAASEHSEALAKEVDNNGGCYFVPAFSGLFSPYWRPDARGAIVGLTAYVTRHHIARAALEAVAYQSRAVMEAMVADSGVDVHELKVDGGMSSNDLLMQFQADQLGVEVIRPKVRETTALGAAYAAGLAVGFWSGIDELTENWQEDTRWKPVMPADERARLYRQWNKAVSKALDWVDDDTELLVEQVESETAS
jgi:glycerol kinase